MPVNILDHRCPSESDEQFKQRVDQFVERLKVDEESLKATREAIKKLIPEKKR